MKLSLVSIDKDGVIRVAADGPITTADFPAEGKNPLETLLGLNWATMRVVMDMSKVNYIDSSAIGWLIGTVRIFRDSGAASGGEGGTFVIHSVQPSVRQIMDVLKVGRVVKIADNEEAARAMVTGESK